MNLKTDNPLDQQQIGWLNDVATVYLQNRQYAKAQPLLLLLVRLCPAELRPLMQLAYLYYQQGNLEQALKCCDRCRSIPRGAMDGRLYLLRSFCHLKLGNKVQAMKDYQQYSALRLMP